MWNQTRTIGEMLNGVAGQVDAFMALMDKQIQDFQAPISKLQFPVPALNVDPFDKVEPRSPDLNLDHGAVFPDPVELTDVVPVAVAMPSHDVDPPALVDRGDLTVQDLPYNLQSPAVNLDVNFPSKPSLQTLTAPSQAAITIPDFEGLELPQWDGTFPDDDLGEISAQYNYSEPAYNTEIYERLRAWIADMIENGGTGLGEEVLAAIRANFRSWLDDELEEEYERILKVEAARGFTVPTGALNARLRTFWNRRARRIQENDNQLMAEEARLAQQNTQFAVQQGVAVEQILREAHNQLATRTLQHAREVVSAAIEIFNARVARYSALLEGAKARAAVYEARIRAAGLLLEQHKTRIDTERLVLDAKNQEVQVYLALQQANAQLIDMWTKEADVVKFSLENERNKILLFKEQIEGYSAQINAERLKVDTHTALLGADQAKVAVYSERMKGYGILVDAVKAQNQMSIDQAALAHEVRNKGRIAVHEAALARADMTIRSHAATEGLKIEKYKAETQGFDSLARAYQAYTSASTGAYDSQMRYASAMIDKAIKEAEINQASLLAEFSSKLDVLKARVQVWAQTLASCLGTLSHSISMGASSGSSSSFSGQIGVPESVSHHHTYCEKACD